MNTSTDLTVILDDFLGHKILAFLTRTGYMRGVWKRSFGRHVTYYTCNVLLEKATTCRRDSVDRWRRRWVKHLYKLQVRDQHADTL